MNYWLVKSEPEAYGWAALVKEGKTAWTGVRNYAARNNLRAMKSGDSVLFYHSGVEKSVVGLARVAQAAYPDPTAEEGDWAAVGSRAGQNPDQSRRAFTNQGRQYPPGDEAGKGVEAVGLRRLPAGNLNSLLEARQRQNVNFLKVGADVRRLCSKTILFSFQNELRHLGAYKFINEQRAAVTTGGQKLHGPNQTPRRPFSAPAPVSCNTAASARSRCRRGASARRAGPSLRRRGCRRARRKSNGSRVRQSRTSSMPAIKPTCRMSPTLGSAQSVCNSSCRIFSSICRARTDGLLCKMSRLASAAAAPS